MPDNPQDAPNADQIAYWNETAGQRWATLQDQIDAMFAPLTLAALEAADARPGDRVLDIGCGCGATVLELAHRVGPTGSVEGVDISVPMLRRAAERLEGVGHASLIEADASTYRFSGDKDLVFSRFGVMFFHDPVGAFINIRTALTPGGRLMMAVWRPLAENAWMHIPLAIAAAHLPPSEPDDPVAPGPFAFADKARLTGILSDAGFTGIAIAAHDTEILLAGPGEVQRAAERALQIGPAARAMTDCDDAARVRIAAAILADYQGRETPSGLSLGGAIWLVSATSDKT